MCIRDRSEPELYNFDPHPAPDVEGMIIGRLDADVTQITQYSSVIINLGTNEGIEPGHVLAVFGRDRQVDDKVSGGTVRIPGERAGLLMVYKVHDLVSYGLVMQAERSIRLRDRAVSYTHLDVYKRQMQQGQLCHGDSANASIDR